MIQEREKSHEYTDWESEIDQNGNALQVVDGLGDGNGGPAVF